MEDLVLQHLAAVHAIIKDSHLVYTSGRHGSAYVNKDAVYPHTKLTSWLCGVIASHFKGESVDVVVAPAIGGVILTQWTAHQLSEMTSGEDILAVYAEKTKDGEFVIKRGYDKLVAGKRVLVVEDILTTGGSVKKVVACVRELGGEIVGVGALCNRGGVSAEDLDVPELFSLVDITLESWPEDECPLCARDVPINTDVGKGREFLQRKRGQ